MHSYSSRDVSKLIYISLFQVDKYQGTRTHEDLKAFIERMKNGNSDSTEPKNTVRIINLQKFANLIDGIFKKR